MATVPVSLASLVATLSKTQAMEIVRAAFVSQRFRVTSWQSGGAGATVLHLLSDLVAQHSSVVAETAKGSLLKHARGTWLKLRAASTYDELPSAASKTVGTMQLASSAGAPPYTIQPGERWVRNTAGLLFRNTTGGTLASGAGQTLSLTFEAQYPGSQYNIPSGSSLEFVTPMAGVTVSNPVTSSGDWITTDGTDEQSDDSLIAQCVAKWATRSYQAPSGVYEYWATKTSDAVTRVYVDAENPDGPGTLRVYLAGPTGAIVSSSIIAAVDAVLQQRRSTCASVTTLGATEQVVAIVGTVYYRGATLAAVQAGVEAAIAALFASIEIGGVKLGDEQGYLFFDSVIDAIRDVAGVVKYAPTAPASDVALPAAAVAVPNVDDITYVMV